MSEVNISISDVCSAFDKFTIGTKVLNRGGFLFDLSERIRTTDFGKLGQVYIDLPEALPYVSGGLALRESITAGQIVVRRHRGNLGIFASRLLAESPKQLGVVVYTRDAYEADPEIDWLESHVLEEAQATHVIVAVLSSPEGAGGEGVMGTYRFVSNLAGGNNRCKAENGYTLDKAVAEAKMCLEYENKWLTVAD